MMITDTHTYTQTNAKNVIFGFKGPQNVYIHQNLHFVNLTYKKNTFSTYTQEKVKNNKYGIKN